MILQTSSTETGIQAPLQVAVSSTEKLLEHPLRKPSRTIRLTFRLFSANESSGGFAKNFTVVCQDYSVQYHDEEATARRPRPFFRASLVIELLKRS